MTAMSILLFLRLLELAILIGCFWWITWSPPSRLRTQRLVMFTVFLLINSAAIVVATGGAKVALW